MKSLLIWMNRPQMTQMQRMFADLIRVNPPHPPDPRSIHPRLFDSHNGRPL